MATQPALDLLAAAAEGSVVACAASGVEHDCPLTAPVEGVHAWEGGGAVADRLDLPRRVLPPAYTAVAWLRLDEGAKQSAYGALLAGGNNAACTIAPDGCVG
eukprot:4442193-Prymnesium_polylepis.1